MLVSYLQGEFLLHIPCLFFYIFFSFFLGSFTYTSSAGLIFIWGVSLTHPVMGLVLSADLLLHIPCWFFTGGVSLTHPVLPSFLCWEFLLHIPCWFLFLSAAFLLHIPCWLYFYLGNFSYTSHAGFIFIW